VLETSSFFAAHSEGLRTLEAALASTDAGARAA